MENYNIDAVIEEHAQPARMWNMGSIRIRK